VRFYGLLAVLAVLATVLALAGYGNEVGSAAIWTWSVIVDIFAGLWHAFVSIIKGIAWVIVTIVVVLIVTAVVMGFLETRL